MKNWKTNSWRKYPVKHIPKYEDDKELNMVLNKLKSSPPLVFAGETRHLKEQLANVVDGKAFLLQGGDCAEGEFAEFHPDNIRDTFKVILQMSLVLTYSASLPVVKLGRIAGQFSKPRIAPTEKQRRKRTSKLFREIILIVLNLMKSQEDQIQKIIWGILSICIYIKFIKSFFKWRICRFEKSSYIDWLY